jgi:hypothetical protein
MTASTKAVIASILDGSLAPGEELTLSYVRFLADADVSGAHRIILELIEDGYIERRVWDAPVTVCAVHASDLADLVAFCCQIELMAASILIRHPQPVAEFPDTAANLADALAAMRDYHAGLVDLASERLGVAYRIFATQLQLCLAQLRRCVDPNFLGQYADLVRDAILAGNEEAAIRYLGVFYARINDLGDPLLGSLDPADVIDDSLELTADEDAFHGCTGK